MRLLALPAFVFASLALDVAYFYQLTNWTGPNWYLFFGGLGALIGQGCFAATLGGLWGRSWLYGFLLSFVLVAAAVCTLFLAMHLSRTMGDGEMFLSLFWMPLIALAAISPLVACRQLFGWQLTAGGDSNCRREQSGIEDLFGVTAVVGATVVLARIPAVYWDGEAEDMWLGVIAYSGFLGVVSMLVVVPAVYFGLRVTRTLHAVLGLIGLGCGAFGLVFSVTLAIFAADRSGTVPALGQVAGMQAITCASATLCTILGMFAVKLSGFKLAVFSKTPGLLTDEDDQAGRQDRALRRRHRIITIAIFAAAVLASIGMGIVESDRFSTDLAHARLTEELELQGGTLEVQQRKIVLLDLGTGVSDATMTKFAHSGPVEELSLAGSKITDDGLPQLMSLPRFEKLDVSDTRITDHGLATIHQLQHLKGLSIGHTQVTRAGIKSLGQMPHLDSLDVAGLGLTDDDLKPLGLGRYESLSLRGNPVTDAGIKQLLQRQAFHEIPAAEVNLDLRDTSVDGSFITFLTPSPTYISELLLDGSRVSDASLLKLSKQSKPLTVERLSLQSTQITDRGVSLIPKVFTVALELTLGGPQITDVRLSKLSFPQLRVLRLPCPQVTGSCFKQWPTPAYELDLSGSGFQDTSAAYLGRVTSNYLRLDHTDVSDACLAELVKIQSLLEISLKHTAVTAEGLISAGFNAHVRVHVADGQFTDDQLQQIREDVNVVIDEDFQPWWED